MVDMSKTVAPKSDQLTADDLISGPRIIKITRVSGADSKEQPVSISYDGDGGKPYKPCLSMRRAMIHVWGNDGQSYIGRRMKLYRDENVLFGGMKVGGIRISHMSDISETVTMALTATRANKRAFTVKPLPAESSDDKTARFRALGNEIAKAMKEAAGPDDVAKIWKDRTGDIEAVKSFSAKAFEGLEKIYKEKGPKETAPSTPEQDDPAMQEEELAL